MDFDMENPVIKLCAKGMALEGEARLKDALALFMEAWELASDDVEKFTAAHYVARRQTSVEEKLRWDQTALAHALAVDERAVQSVLPSLYLNIGKCYEDMGNIPAALEQYRTAESYLCHLSHDGYGGMIRKGIQAGIARLTNQ